MKNYQNDAAHKSGVDSQSHQRSDKLQSKGSTAANEPEEEAEDGIGADVLIRVLARTAGHQTRKVNQNYHDVHKRVLFLLSANKLNLEPLALVHK